MGGLVSSISFRERGPRVSRSLKLPSHASLRPDSPLVGRPLGPLGGGTPLIEPCQGGEAGQLISPSDYSRTSRSLREASTRFGPTGIHRPPHRPTCRAFWGESPGGGPNPAISPGRPTAASVPSTAAPPSTPATRAATLDLGDPRAVCVSVGRGRAGRRVGERRWGRGWGRGGGRRRGKNLNTPF